MSVQSFNIGNRKTDLTCCKPSGKCYKWKFVKNGHKMSKQNIELMFSWRNQMSVAQSWKETKSAYVKGFS